MHSLSTVVAVLGLLRMHAGKVAPPLYQELGRDGTPMAFATGGWFLSEKGGVVMNYVVNFEKTDCSDKDVVINNIVGLETVTSSSARERVRLHPCVFMPT